MQSRIVKDTSTTNIMSDEKSPFEIELENVESPIALEWALEKNRLTKNAFTNSVDFKKMEADALEIYEDKRKIPYVKIHKDGFLYNFWRDENHVQGIWRRTTLAEYRKSEPDWEILLDFDNIPEQGELNKLVKQAHQPDEKWVYQGAELNLTCDKALIELSLGGTDACIFREFDLKTKKFVKDGFDLAEAKSTMSWCDDDSVFVQTNFGPGDLTESGYARISKLWHRNEPLEAAKTIFEAKCEDISVEADIERRPEGDFVYVSNSHDFYNCDYYRLNLDDLSLQILPLPADAILISYIKGDIIVHLRSDWFVPNGPQYKADSVIAITIDSLDDPMHLNTSLVRKSTATCSVRSVQTVQNLILIEVLNNVCGELYEYHKLNGKWEAKLIPLPKNGDISVQYPDNFSDDYLIAYTNFLTPATLYYYHSDSQSLEVLKEAPTNFDASNLCINQYYATSKDGTSIPYFIVHPKHMLLDGNNPTVLEGYGGFENSMTPSYLGAQGKLWSENGGVYVLANIRGGGEFGPNWHQAALLKNRHKAFEDFIAVAEDLIAKKITSPKHLGILGASNGGLLVGAVFTQRPDLFNAVSCGCPLLDMLNYHKWSAGSSWMAEYGDPEDPEMREVLRGYSPYHQLSADKQYPQVLFTTSRKDDRVHLAHARKMVARMNDLGHQVYYYEITEGGHSGASNLKMYAFNIALETSYFKKMLMENKLTLKLDSLGLFAKSVETDSAASCSGRFEPRSPVTR